MIRASLLQVFYQAAVREILAAFHLEVMHLEIFIFISGLIIFVGLVIILVMLLTVGRGKDDD